MRAGILSAQISFSIQRNDVYKSEVTEMEKDLVKTLFERAHLQRSVKYLVLMVRDASVGLGGALHAVAKSSHRPSVDVADKVKTKKN